MKELSTLIISSICILAACTTSMSTPADCDRIAIEGETLPGDVLVHRTGVAEAESKNLRDGKPFGDRNHEWEELKAEIEAGDELWLYRDNRTMSGAEGYVLVRNCEVVAFVMTMKY